jgi:hypothetical protein
MLFEQARVIESSICDEAKSPVLAHFSRFRVQQ